MQLAFDARTLFLSTALDPLSLLRFMQQQFYSSGFNSYLYMQKVAMNPKRNLVADFSEQIKQQNCIFNIKEDTSKIVIKQFWRNPSVPKYLLHIWISVRWSIYDFDCLWIWDEYFNWFRESDWLKVNLIYCWLHCFCSLGIKRRIGKLFIGLIKRFLRKIGVGAGAEVT